MEFLKCLRKDERGATAIEYGLIVALIVIAIIASLALLAGTTTGMWNTVANQVSGRAA